MKETDPKTWPLLSASFSPDSKQIAFSGGGLWKCTPKIWIARVPSLETVTLLEGHTSGITDLAWGERGLVSSSADFSVRLWDIETGTSAAIVKGDHRPKTRLAFGKDDALWIGEAEFIEGKTARLLRASLTTGKVETVRTLPVARIMRKLAVDRVTDRWAYSHMDAMDWKFPKLAVFGAKQDVDSDWFPEIYWRDGRLGRVLREKDVKVAAVAPSGTVFRARGPAIEGPGWTMKPGNDTFVANVMTCAPDGSLLAITADEGAHAFLLDTKTGAVVTQMEAPALFSR